MWPVKKYDKEGRKNSLDKRKLRRAQRLYLTLAKVSIIKRVWIEHLIWKERKLWVVSAVMEIKKSKKKTHGRQNLLIQKKSALIRVKIFNK